MRRSKNYPSTACWQEILGGLARKDSNVTLDGTVNNDQGSANIMKVGVTWMFKRER
jgi:hypothetical protein